MGYTCGFLRVDCVWMTYPWMRLGWTCFQHVVLWHIYSKRGCNRRPSIVREILSYRRHPVTHVLDPALQGMAGLCLVALPTDALTSGTGSPDPGAWTPAPPASAAEPWAGLHRTFSHGAWGQKGPLGPQAPCQPSAPAGSQRAAGAEHICVTPGLLAVGGSPRRCCGPTESGAPAREQLALD